MINAVNGLLLMSVIVALIGIVNTLSLSVIERRRELGLLRVVGMVDKRVQRMVRLESVVISSLGTSQRHAPRNLHRRRAWSWRSTGCPTPNIPITLPWVQLLVVLVARHPARVARRAGSPPAAPPGSKCSRRSRPPDDRAPSFTEPLRTPSGSVQGGSDAVVVTARDDATDL